MDALKNVTIGADIELFLKNTITDEYISAEGYAKGTKKDPFVFSTDSKYFATTLDNVLYEFSIPPAKTKQEFYSNIQRSLGYIRSTLPDGICTMAIPAANLDLKYLQTKQAKEFGCEPDFNAYTKFMNETPYCGDPTLRSAGGHIHIGFDGALPLPKDMIEYVGDKQRCDIIKVMDLFIGVPSIIMEPDNKRKELYGKAGCFRPKSYGVEYRTVSNFYLKSKELTLWVYDAVKKGINFINNGFEIAPEVESYVVDAINNNDKRVANLLIKEFSLNLI